MIKNIFNWKGIVISVLFLELVLLTQLKFTAWPEMTLWPYLMLKGWLPYKDIAIAHNPLLLFSLAGFYKLSGLGLVQLKIFTWGLVLLSSLATFWVTKKLWNQKIATLALLILIPLNVFYEANGLWFDLALVPLYVFIFYFVRQRKFTSAGVFWVLSFLVKQTAIFLLIPLIIEMGGKKIVRNFESFLLGSLVVFIPFLLLMWGAGVLPDYVHWTINFAGTRLPFSEGQVVYPSLRQLILGGWPFVILLCLMFIKARQKYFNLILWALFAGLGVFPRWELFHILPSTPFFAVMLSLLLIDSVKLQKAQKYVLWFGITVFLLLSLKKLIVSWHQETRFFESEAISAAEFVGERVAQDEIIFVLNYWDHFYAMSDTLPATRPWLPQFSWYLNYPGVQEKMLSDLISRSPMFIVYHPYSESGLDSYRPWMLADYVEKYYQPVRFYSNFEILEKR